MKGNRLSIFSPIKRLFFYLKIPTYCDAYLLKKNGNFAV